VGIVNLHYKQVPHFAEAGSHVVRAPNGVPLAGEKGGLGGFASSSLSDLATDLNVTY